MKLINELVSGQVTERERELQRLIEDGVAAGAGTVEDLAREAGVAYATVHAWTSGRRRPSRPNLLRLAAVLERRSERLARVASALRARAERRNWAAEQAERAER